MVASWSELGHVSIWSLDRCLQKLEEPGGSTASVNKGNEGGNINKQPEFYKDKSSPLHTFKGHAMEGFALAWSPTTTGVMASGDCQRNIHLWKPTDAGGRFVCFFVFFTAFCLKRRQESTAQCCSWGLRAVWFCQQ